MKDNPSFEEEIVLSLNDSFQRSVDSILEWYLSVKIRRRS